MGVTSVVIESALHPPPQANPDEAAYSDPQLLAAGVPQVPADVARLWASHGDKGGDKRLSPDQFLRLMRSITIARKKLRQLRLEQVRQQTSWIDPDTGYRGCNVRREVWLAQDRD